MKRLLLLVLGLSLLVPMAAIPAAAQEEGARPATYLYEAYYKVNFADMDEWNRLFETYDVPVLEALQSEGVIDGWGHWEHNTGSDYNIRHAIRLFDWPSIDTFWDELLDRTFGAMSEADREITTRIIQAHDDQIWEINSTTFAENPGENALMYASTFDVSFADMGEWNRIWNEDAIPVLQEAMAQGILNGVVILGHNTGPHNSKVLYLFDDWDDIDDMWDLFFTRMEEQHGEDFTNALRMSRSHDDVIWASAVGN